MKKFYVKKGAFEQVDLPMTRRHTRAGVEYSSAAESDKTRRSNSVDDRGHVAARVITETDLTSSSLYKYRKAQMDSIDDEESNITGSRAQLIDRATQDSLRRDSESSMPPFLPYSVMAKKVQRKQNSRSCCCHALMAMGLIIAVGCIGMGIGGVVYMELYATKTSSQSTKLEGFVTEQPYGFGDLFEFGNITKIVLGDYFVPEVDVKANDFQDNANDQSNSNEQLGLNILDENTIAIGLDDVSKSIEDLKNNKRKGLDVDRKVGNEISSDTLQEMTDVTYKQIVNTDQDSSDVSVLIEKKNGDQPVVVSQDKYNFSRIDGTTSSDAEKTNTKEGVTENHDKKTVIVHNLGDTNETAYADQGHDEISNSRNTDKNLIEVGGGETVSVTDNSQTFEKAEEDRKLTSLQDTTDEISSDDGKRFEGTRGSVLLERTTTENIEHQGFTQQTTLHPVHGADEDNWKMSGNHLDKDVLKTFLDDDKMRLSKDESLIEKDDVSVSESPDIVVIPGDKVASHWLEVKSSAPSETTSEFTNSDHFHSASVPLSKNSFQTEEEEHEKDQLENTNYIEIDGLFTMNSVEDMSHVTNGNRIRGSIDIKHEKPKVNDQTKNKDVDHEVTIFQDRNVHFTTDNGSQLQHVSVTVRSGLLETDLHDKDVGTTETSTNLKMDAKTTNLEPIEHFSTTKTQILSQEDRLRFDLDKSTVPEVSKPDDSAIGLTERFSTTATTNLNNGDRLRFDLDKSTLTEDTNVDDLGIDVTEHLSTTTTKNLNGDRLRFDLDKSIISEDLKPTKPSVAEKITPFEFLRRLEMDQKLSELPPLSAKDMNRQFTLSEALEYIRSLDSKNKLPDSQQQIPHKRVTRSQSKEDLEFERKIYLNHLRKKLYDKDD